MVAVKLGVTPVFIIGSPRSGSTWLQALLGAHPLVATSVELTVFHHYVAPWLEKWEFEAKLRQNEVPQGLAFVLGEAWAEQWLARFIEEVYRAVAARKSGCRFLLDKQPAYSPYVRVIDRFLPDSRFVHIIRDGRDVAASLRRAGRSMVLGQMRIYHGAKLWSRYVRAARDAAVLEGRYVEVRYEALRQAPERELARVLDGCGIPWERGWLEETVRALGYEAMEAARRTADPAVAAHPMHYQGARMGRWQREFSLADRHDFDRVAGDLLCELGYARPGWWKQRWWEAVAVPVAGVGRRAARTLPQLIVGLRRGLAGQRVRAGGTAAVTADSVRGAEQGEGARAPQP